MTDTNTDIAKLAADALAAATAPEKVREIVEREIGKTVEDAIKASVRSYSPFGRELEKKLEEAMGINSLNLPSYGQMMTDLVQRLVQKHVANLVGARLEQDLTDILSIAPKRIKLSEIANAMREEHEGAYGDVITCHVRDSDRHEDSDFRGPSWTVYLDDRQHHARPQDASVRIEISHGIRDKAGPPKHEITTGKIWMIQSDGRSVTTGSREGWHGTFRRPDKVYGLEERLLAYYAAGTIIEIDEDNIVTSVGDY
jgi:hypothetical protein